MPADRPTDQLPGPLGGTPGVVAGLLTPYYRRLTAYENRRRPNGLSPPFGRRRSFVSNSRPDARAVSPNSKTTDRSLARRWRKGSDRANARRRPRPVRQPTSKRLDLSGDRRRDFFGPSGTTAPSASNHRPRSRQALPP